MSETAGRTAAGRPLFVEVVGLPGSGKTTLVRHVVSRLSARDVRVVVARRTGPRVADPASEVDPRTVPQATRLQKMRAHVALHLRWWRLAIASYRCLLAARRRRGELARLVRALLFTVANIREACRIVGTGRAHVALFSQGVVAYLRQLSGAQVDGAAAQLDEVAHHLGRSLRDIRFLFVVLETDAATAAARVESRAGDLGPWDRLPQDERLQRMELERPIIDAVLDTVVAHLPGARVLRVDGMRSPAASSLDVTRLLTSLIDGEADSRMPPWRTSSDSVPTQRRGAGSFSVERA